MTKLSGNIVDVVAGTIRQGSVYFNQGKIEKIEYGETGENRYIAPGFIDSHVHVESSMLVPSEFARLAVVHGTVATISDPHEIANVMGVEGVKYMLENARKVPFKCYFGAPSCVPATNFETAGATINAAQIDEILAWPEIKYLAEMMNYPGVLHRDPEVWAKLEAARKHGKPIDGHLPGLGGETARQYASAGISTDHECFGLQEALDKVEFGMKILIREGSAAKNFEALWPLIDQHPEKVMFCSDDKHPNDLIVGHINQLAARAVAKGCQVMNVLRACSLNVVKHYGLEVGLLQSGDPADCCVLEDLSHFKVTQTWINGECVAENGQSKLQNITEREINQFDCEPVRQDQLQVAAQQGKVKAIVVEDGQLITKKKSFVLAEKDGLLQVDIAQDVLKMVVMNRYSTQPPAVCFVHNFGLKRGAIASTVAHDSHNIIAVGSNDTDLVQAINLLVANKGGISVADGALQEVLPLPVAGLMSTQDGYEVAEAYSRIDAKARAMGTQLAAPYMTLSFCALLVIPELKLSDLGLFDGINFSFTSLFED